MDHVYWSGWEKAGPEVLRGVHRALNRIGVEIDKVGVGGVVAGKQPFLSQPLPVIATQEGLELLTIGRENAGRDIEIRKVLHRKLIEVSIGRNGSSDAVAAEDHDLF